MAAITAAITASAAAAGIRNTSGDTRAKSITNRHSRPHTRHSPASTAIQPMWAVLPPGRNGTASVVVPPMT